MKYRVEGLVGYSLMSDHLIIEADNRKKSVQEFFLRTKNIKVKLSQIVQDNRKNHYSFSILPVKVDETRYTEGKNYGLTKLGKYTFLGIYLGKKSA